MLNKILSKIEFILSEKICLLILISVSSVTILLSRYLYNYDLINQDADAYLAFAKDLNNYFYLDHQDALRVFPIILVVIFSKVLNINVESSFYLINYIFFFFLILKTFFFFKYYEISNYLSLTFIAILYYLHHSVLYTLFNPYQICDLLAYIYILFFFQLPKKKEILPLFLLCLISTFTKEYFFILSIFSMLYQYIIFKNIRSIYYIIIFLILFILHFNFASSGIENIDSKSSVGHLILSYFLNFNLFFNSFLESLIINKNIMLFFPFITVFFFKKFINLLREYIYLLPFMLIPILFSIFLFQNVGNNFFRVFFQGYYIFIVLCLLFIGRIIDKKNLSLLLLVSPIFFLLDFFYIFFNIKQHGFFLYFQHVRFETISGFHIFNLVFIISLFLIKKRGYE
jgi:hypothetical protein